MPNARDLDAAESRATDLAVAVLELVAPAPDGWFGNARSHSRTILGMDLRVYQSLADDGRFCWTLHRFGQQLGTAKDGYRTAAGARKYVLIEAGMLISDALAVVTAELERM